MKNRKNNSLFSFLIIIIIIIIASLLWYITRPTKGDETETIFKLVDTNVQLRVGSQKQLVYMLSDPSLLVNWSSNDPSISVDVGGMITANSFGQAVITATVNAVEKTIVKTCTVTAYEGNVSSALQDIILPSGYLYMRPNAEYDIPVVLVPNDAYITSIKYISSDENVFIIDNNRIISKNEGDATFEVIINNNYYKSMPVKVSEDAKSPRIVDKAEEVTFLETAITMEMGDTRELKYEIEPPEGYVESYEWSSSDENIIKVQEGMVEAINIGEAIVELKINDELVAEAKITVKSTNENIIINHNPKTLITVGESTIIDASISPSNVNDIISYKSSNPSVAVVNNGVITGVGKGSTMITLSIVNGKTRTFRINVLPKSGSLTGSANFWGYKSLNNKKPVYAGNMFYQRIAQGGVGTLQGNIYRVTGDGITFSYDINTCLLSANGKVIKVRVYYPQGVDLSKTNTLTFMGGRGETNFDGMFAKIEKDTSIIKSGGIVILVAEGNNTAFDGDAGAYATMFVKALTRQKNGVKNSILGFSDGANKVLHSSKRLVYDKVIIFSGYTDGASSVNNAKNSEIIVIIAPNDGNYQQAKSMVRSMKDSGYTNVKMITNGKDAISLFSDRFLVITPGNIMKNAHDTINIINSGIISYAND